MERKLVSIQTIDAIDPIAGADQIQQARVVIRPLVEQHSETLGGRLSFKVINNDFLLKDED